MMSAILLKLFLLMPFWALGQWLFSILIKNLEKKSWPLRIILGLLYLFLSALILFLALFISVFGFND